MFQVQRLRLYPFAGKMERNCSKQRVECNTTSYAFATHRLSIEDMVEFLLRRKVMSATRYSLEPLRLRGTSR
jgi:hypothetical protein